MVGLGVDALAVGGEKALLLQPVADEVGVGECAGERDVGAVIAPADLAE